MTATRLVGAQTPRVEAIPEYASSAGEEAIEFCTSIGLHLDPWQQYVMTHSLGERRDNRWSAFEVGVLVPRQNGKGALLEARELAGLFLFDEKLILHSAHEFKDLDVTTPILTSRGWSTMGELVAGDEVYAPDGQPTKVVAAHPVLRTSDCYRVTFADGQSLIAGSGHLWDVTEVARSGQVERRVVTTDEIRRAGLVHRWQRTGRDRNIYRWRVDLPDPVLCPPADLPVDPYLMGMWLGDGTTAKGELTVGAEDHDYVLSELDKLGESYRVRPDCRCPDRVFTVIIAGLRARLRGAGVLGAKRIHDAYLTASVSQRRALLAGIMDTDGTVSGHQLVVTMTNAALMADVASLVRSLGYRATERTFRASLNGRDAGPMYRVQFAPTDVSPFRLPRKTAKIQRLRTSRSAYNAIVDVEQVPTRPTRCITVAHESSCYLVGRGFVPTHNTAQEAFRRVLFHVENNPALRKRIKPRGIRTSHGEEGIELTNGARLRFVARSTGSGRGFSGDTVILDEAYNLSSEGMSALLPTLSARPNPQIWYTSSAGMASSHQLRKVRERGVAGSSRRLAFFEWSADPTVDMDDPRGWAQANPALGIRITEEFVQSERDAMDDLGFARERLGLWAEIADQAVIDAELWARLYDPGSRIVGPTAFAVDMPWDRSSVVVAAGGRRVDGRSHGELIEQQPGTSWAVPFVVEKAAKWRPCAVLIDGGGPAASLRTDLEPELEKLGIPLMAVPGPEMARACGAFYDAATQDGMRHLGDDRVSAALAGAKKSDRGDVWRWDRRDSKANIAPLVAFTLAVHGAAAYGNDGGVPNLW